MLTAKLFLIPAALSKESTSDLPWEQTFSDTDGGDIEPVCLVTWDGEYLPAEPPAEERVDFSSERTRWHYTYNSSVSKEELIQFRDQCHFEKIWTDVMLFNCVGDDVTLKELENKSNEIGPVVEALNRVIEENDFKKFSVCYAREWFWRC